MVRLCFIGKNIDSLLYFVSYFNISCTIPILVNDIKTHFRTSAHRQTWYGRETWGTRCPQKDVHHHFINQPLGQKTKMRENLLRPQCPSRRVQLSRLKVNSLKLQPLFSRAE